MNFAAPPPVVTRFAPSPTGRLHLGHAFSAIRAHDFARGSGGRFLLRIEDIDPGRAREEYVAGIEEDLRWLGLEWDGHAIRQSARLHLYARALNRLKRDGLVYPCFCTRAEIAASAAAPHHDAGPVYPGTCRALPPAERAARMAREAHCWRLDMVKAVETANLLLSARGERVGERGSPITTSGTPEVTGLPLPSAAFPPALRAVGTLAGSAQPSLPRERGLFGWHDSSRGWIAATPEQHGDVVLARKDAPVSYHLAVTVDDAAQGVSDVVRGEDLFAATHIHRLLQALLDLPTPRYHHHPLLTGPDGRRLAKRDGAPTLSALREGGADPARLLADLRAGIGDASIGFTPADA